MKTKDEIETGLAHCIGTEKYIKHWTGALVFTDGVDFLRQAADCFWLVDAIASYQPEHKDKTFQLWELKVTEEDGDRKAVLTMREDSDRPALVTQKFYTTNFPLDEIKLYVELGGFGTCAEDWTPAMVLMVPSER
jgi:hypothetical protein